MGASGCDNARNRVEELERVEGGGSDATLEAALIEVANSDFKRARKLSQSRASP